jgi:hypothetical protein
MEDLKEELEELKKRKQELEDEENEEEYNEMINEMTPEVVIFNMHYLPSRALKELDPIAYSCGHHDYNDPLITEIDEKIKDKEQEIADYKEE